MEALIYKGLEGVGFTEANPDKGTKTYKKVVQRGGQSFLQLFTEANPDKGTKTYKSINGDLVECINVYRS